MHRNDQMQGNQRERDTVVYCKAYTQRSLRLYILLININFHAKMNTPKSCHESTHKTRFI